MSHKTRRRRTRLEHSNSETNHRKVGSSGQSRDQSLSHRRGSTQNHVSHYVADQRRRYFGGEHSRPSEDPSHTKDRATSRHSRDHSSSRISTHKPYNDYESRGRTTIRESSNTSKNQKKRFGRSPPARDWSSSGESDEGDEDTVDGVEEGPSFRPGSSKPAETTTTTTPSGEGGSVVVIQDKKQEDLGDLGASKTRVKPSYGALKGERERKERETDQNSKRLDESYRSRISGWWDGLTFKKKVLYGTLMGCGAVIGATALSEFTTAIRSDFGSTDRDSGHSRYTSTLDTRDTGSADYRSTRGTSHNESSRGRSTNGTRDTATSGNTRRKGWFG